jgi:hypothetical protein
VEQADVARNDLERYPSNMTLSRGPATVSLARLMAMLPPCLVASTMAAQAHAFPRPYDLPLPLGHYLIGAGAAVVLSFLAAIGLMRAPGRVRERALVLPPRLTDALLSGLRCASVALFALLIAVGLFGNQGDWDRNLLPIAIWVVWWVGLAFACALVRNLWPLVNPWAAVGRWAEALARCLREPGSTPTRLPDRVGVWPAVALFLLFAWVELVWPSNAVPARLACATLVYSALTWAGMALFGIEAWLQRGEVFSLLFGLFGRFAPLSARRDDEGRPYLILRPYGSGLAPFPLVSISTAAFIVTVLATVSFDGISETPAWARVSGASIGLLYALGAVRAIGYVAAQSLVKTAGLVAAPLAFAALYLATCRLAAWLDGAETGVVARRFVLTLAPIAIGYHLAHYFSYLIIQGQMIIPLASDPFGFGWDLWGTRGYRVDIDAVDMRLVWLVAVSGIVLGHAAAVFLAHRAALGASMRFVAQMPLVILMIAYTVSSLWILSQPIVAH